MDYLDFEQPVKELLDQLKKAKALQEESKVDMAPSIKAIEDNLKKTRKDIKKNLTAWQRVQLTRHPQRPYTLAYI